MALLNPPILETTMQQVANRPEQAAIRIDLGAIFVSMELSRSSWLITSLSPGGGEKMSKHSLRGGDVAGLLELFATLQEKARARTGERFRIIVIQEAGLDGFWIHRVLQGEAIESHVVDAASILVSRRRRRAKTDKIDGETLVRTLLAYKRGEPRVCSMGTPRNTNPHSPPLAARGFLHRDFRTPDGTRNPYMGMVNYKRHHVDIVIYLRGNP
jgi:transposase